MSEEHDDAVTTKHDGETSGEALCALRTIAALLRGGVDTGPADALDWVSAKMRSYADQIEAAAERVKVAIEQERRQLRSLVGRFANCHEDNEDFGVLLREARFVLTDTPYAVVDGEPVAVLHGRVAEKAGAESRLFVGVDLAKDKPTFVCATIAPGNAAAKRDALKRILAIKGYGAPWIEAKCIAKKALESEQYTPPIAKETAKIEQSSNAAAMREALERCNELFRCDDDNKSRLCNLARKADEATQAALAAPARNCDARDVHEAWRDFLADKRFADCSATFQAGANAAIRWLYATAQEGGAE